MTFGTFDQSDEDTWPDQNRHWQWQWRLENTLETCDLWDTDYISMLIKVLLIPHTWWWSELHRNACHVEFQIPKMWDGTMLALWKCEQPGETISCGLLLSPPDWSSLLNWSANLIISTRMILSLNGEWVRMLVWSDNQATLWLNLVSPPCSYSLTVIINMVVGGWD